MKSKILTLAAMASMSSLAVAPAMAGQPSAVDARAADAARQERVEALEARVAREAESVGRAHVELVAAEQEAVRAEAEAQRGEEEAEVRLREAEMRLEQAAREIAELTAEIVGEVTPAVIEGVNHGLKRALLGVNVKNVGDDDDKAEGVLVVGVTPGWPADEAGIRTGDVLVGVNGTNLDWAGDASPMGKLMDALAKVEPGDTVKVDYRRDGKAQSVDVVARSLAQGFAFYTGDGDMEFHEFAPPPPVPGAPQIDRDVRILRHRIMERWGDMELVELTPGLGDYFGTDEGVLVVRAPKDDTLGLKDGDVILDIGGRKPVDPGHVMRILRSYEPGEKLGLTIVRNKKRQTLSVDIPERELSRMVPEAPPAVPAPTALPAPAAPPAPKPAPLKT